MFESRISAGASEKLPCSGKLGANISSWSHDMESHAKKCVGKYCELANKTTQQLYKVATPYIDDHQFKDEIGSCSQLYKVSTPCIDDHHSKEEELKSVRELSKSILTNCSDMFVFGSYWET